MSFLTNEKSLFSDLLKHDYYKNLSTSKNGSLQLHVTSEHFYLTEFSLTFFQNSKNNLT